MTEASSPLKWPAGRARTPDGKRQWGQFRNGDQRISRPAAISRLADEVRRLGGRNLVVSSDLPVRRDGAPKAKRLPPSDPGVVAYFSLGEQAVSLPCDTFHSIAQNIAAIAAHVEATRRIERYGVASASETLQAFTALPSAANTAPTWREVLGLKPDFPEGYEPEDAEIIVKARWKSRATAAHPDTGGTVEKMAELNAAKDEAVAAIRGLPRGL